ncbi:MAG TPA: phage portal protein [Thermoanaerobaculia bacterium]|nr:phage portal protein [Thermoanaerobaculia bacterium]
MLRRLKKLWYGSSSHPTTVDGAMLRKLIAAAEAKSLRPGDLLPAGASTRAKWTDYSPRTAIDEGLKASVWVYACTTLIARAAGSLPWRAERLVGGEWTPDPTSPLQDLINRPNPAWTWEVLVQHITYLLLLAGESVVPKLRAKSSGRSALYGDRGIPVELWALSPENFKVIPGTDGQLISAYEDTVRKRKIDPEDVLHPLFVNPGDAYRGLAPLEATQKDVDTDVEAATWQKISFQNRAVPDGIFKFKEYFDDEAWQEAKKQFREEYYGAQNARKPLLLGNDIDWIDLAKTAVEMDFQAGRKLTRENICAGFGVPPVLVGILDRATYSNFEQAEESFWKLGMLPYIGMLKGLFNSQLAPEFGSEVRMTPDLSGVDALIPMFQRRWDIVKEMTERGIPMSSANDRMGLGLKPYPGWDVGLVPANLVPLETFTAEALGDGE